MIKEIEVKEAHHCTGTCEACECKSTKNEMITFEASFRAESEKSISALYWKGNPEGTSWACAKWFPKKICTFSEIRPYGRFEITAPKWFLEKLNIIDKLTIYGK